MNVRRGSDRIIGGRGKVQLGKDAQRKLDDLVATHGVGGAAKRLGVGLYIVEQLAWGGSMRPPVVERVTKLLEERAA